MVHAALEAAKFIPDFRQISGRDVGPPPGQTHSWPARNSGFRPTARGKRTLQHRTRKAGEIKSGSTDLVSGRRLNPMILWRRRATLAFLWIYKFENFLQNCSPVDIRSLFLLVADAPQHLRALKFCTGELRPAYITPVY